MLIPAQGAPRLACKQGSGEDCCFGQRCAHWRWGTLIEVIDKEPSEGVPEWTMMNAVWPSEKIAQAYLDRTVKSMSTIETWTVTGMLGGFCGLAGKPWDD